LNSDILPTCSGVELASDEYRRSSAASSWQMGHHLLDQFRIVHRQVSQILKAHPVANAADE
jgi:hypothetical protein